jgi:hypothetical protein
MTPIESTLRELITDAKASGMPLSRICRLSGVGYFQVYNWLRGRTRMIPAHTAERVLHTLTTGKRIK